jgi:hypothetical protein
MTTEEKLQIAEAKILELTTLLSQALARTSELEALVSKLSTPKTSTNVFHAIWAVVDMPTPTKAAG